VIGLCRFFGPGVLPSQVMAESASVLRMVHVWQIAHQGEDGEPGEDGSDDG